MLDSGADTKSRGLLMKSKMSFPISKHIVYPSERVQSRMECGKSLPQGGPQDCHTSGIPLHGRARLAMAMVPKLAMAGPWLAMGGHGMLIAGNGLP